MNSVKRFVISVRCPIDNISRQIQMEYVELENSKKFFLPCNGCDNCHGSKRCEQCRAALTLMFHNGYEHTIGKDVIPDFEVLK